MIKSYPNCAKFGLNIIELSPDFSKRAVWADDVEKILMVMPIEKRLEQLEMKIDGLFKLLNKIEQHVCEFEPLPINYEFSNGTSISSHKLICKHCGKEKTLKEGGI